MRDESFTEMQRAYLARILLKICEKAGLDAEDIFQEAASEIASSYGDRENADMIRSELRL